MQQHTAHHLHWHSTLQLVQHCSSTGTAIAYGKRSYILCDSTQPHHYIKNGTSITLTKQATYNSAVTACGKTSYICDSTQHTIGIGTAHFNWYSTALQIAQQLHMAKQATHASTQHTIYIGTAHFNWYGTALQQAQQLHMAKQATYATAHSTPGTAHLAQHTSTGTALRFNWHSNFAYGKTQATYVTAHSTPSALAQHTSTGTALHFDWHSNCIWQNNLHMQ